MATCSVCGTVLATSTASWVHPVESCRDALAARLAESEATADRHADELDAVHRALNVQPGETCADGARRVAGLLAESQHWRERHCRESQANAEQSAKNWEEARRLREQLAEERRKVAAAVEQVQALINDLANNPPRKLPKDRREWMRELELVLALLGGERATKEDGDG